LARIALEGVTKVFASEIVAVNEVSIEISDGEFMVLVGPSGCGKSTILRLLSGLDDVTDGEIWIGDRKATDLPAKERDVAMIFQNYAIYPHMTVAQNIGFGLKLRRTKKETIQQRVTEVARMLGLEELLERKPATLSGGQRQRVAIGRAIVRDPVAFLMDEPLSNLDAKLRVQMRAELARIHNRLQRTTVFVTHDQVEAMTLGNRVAVLKEGVLQQLASPQEVFRHPANLFVAAFIGSPPMNLVEAEVGAGEVAFGGYRLPLPREVDLSVYEGRTVILGIRPSDLEDADVWTGETRPVIEAPVEVIEDLGSEVNVIFTVQSPPVVTEDTQAAIEDGGNQAGIPLVGAEGTSAFTARVDPRSRVTAGGRVRLSVDPERFHFFDPITSRSISSKSPVSVVP
jgi:multiple sugar transport system ATP-binding protein